MSEPTIIVGLRKKLQEAAHFNNGLELLLDHKQVKELAEYLTPDPSVGDLVRRIQDWVSFLRKIGYQEPDSDIVLLREAADALQGKASVK